MSGGARQPAEAPRRLGVLGWPVAHSRSPAMFEAAFAAAGLEGWTYQHLPVPPEAFAETVRALPAAGFAGANVTIPHKHAALAVADEASAAARAIGAANVLTFAGGRIAADNTDAPGILATLPAPPADRIALVLGAGGSARAAVAALVGAGARVLVWNRTPARAEELVAAVGGRAVAADDPELARAELLVNCTSVGMAPGDPTWELLPVARAAIADMACVVDLVYGARTTALVEAARSAGVAAVDGLDVLVAQGALAFTAWTGAPAPADAMRAAARR